MKLRVKLKPTVIYRINFIGKIIKQITHKNCVLSYFECAMTALSRDSSSNSMPFILLISDIIDLNMKQSNYKIMQY